MNTETVLPMYFANIEPIDVNSVLSVYFEELSSQNVNVIIVGANSGAPKDLLFDYLHLENVTAVLVEPISELLEELKSKLVVRKNLHFENSAVDTRLRKRVLYRLKGAAEFPVWSEGLASFNKRVLLSHGNQLKGMKKYVVEEVVNCITFESLVKKYSLSSINVLQIDTEGYDYEIVKNINFEKHKPDIMIIEYLHITVYEYYSLIKLLQDQNYKVYGNPGFFDILAIDDQII